MSVGGETARSLTEQAARISACSLKFFWEDDVRGADGWAAGRIVNSGLRFHVPGEDQGSLWEDRVVLDEVFWKALREHPVPLLEAAIRQLRDRSMSLDIYVWLAWRLHTLLGQAAPVWTAIHAQFGAGFHELFALQAPVHRGACCSDRRLSGGQGGRRRRWGHPAPIAASYRPHFGFGAGSRLTPHRDRPDRSF